MFQKVTKLMDLSRTYYFLKNTNMVRVQTMINVLNFNDFPCSFQGNVDSQKYALSV